MMISRVVDMETTHRQALAVDMVETSQEATVITTTRLLRAEANSAVIIKVLAVDMEAMIKPVPAGLETSPAQVEDTATTRPVQADLETSLVQVEDMVTTTCPPLVGVVLVETLPAREDMATTRLARVDTVETSLAQVVDTATTTCPPLVGVDTVEATPQVEDMEMTRPLQVEAAMEVTIVKAREIMALETMTALEISIQVLVEVV